MNRPSYKELWSDEYKDRDEQLQWIRNAVNGNAKFCNSEPPYSEEEELARKIMQMHARIAELEGKIDQLTAHSDIERQDDKWIPVSERLPDNWESVLTIDISKSTRDMVTAFYNPETSLWSTHVSCDLWVTHWMPLPEPPIVYGKVCEE